MSEEKKEKKAPAKKATTAKKTATKATAKKTTTKTAAKKPATKVAKTATKAATKTAAKKTATKAATKTTAKKTAAKKTTTKTTTKKATTKTAAKKTTAKTTKKAPAKKTTRAKKVEEVVADDAKLIQDLEMEDAALNKEPVVETPVEVPVESTSTNEFGTTTISAEVSKAYVQQPVEEQPFTTTVSQEEKKARKGGRKVIITMVIVIILAIAAFLGLWYFSKITAHNKIVDTLDKLKAGDQATEVELIDLTNTLGLDVPTETNTENVSDLLITNNETNTNTDTDTTTSLTNEIIQQSKKDEKDYIDFFKKMEYEIVEEKADFVDGYVKVKIINKNIGKIIKKYYVRAFALSIRTAFSTQESSQVQENLDSYLKQLLTSDEIERVSTEVTFKLKREGFEWKLDVNKEELCDAILPGLREQLKDFEF
jgi:Tfp pilus assembly major pilin PilA